MISSNQLEKERCLLIFWLDKALQYKGSTSCNNKRARGGKDGEREMVKVNRGSRVTTQSQVKVLEKLVIS